MEKTIKEAADSLLNRGEITQEEYNSIDFEKIGAVNFGKILQAVGESYVRKAPSAIQGHLASDIPNALVGTIGSMTETIGQQAAKNIFESATKSRVLQKELMRNPAFRKEYMKLVSGDIKSDAFSDAVKNPVLVKQLGENLTKKNPLDIIGKPLQNAWAVPALLGSAFVAKEGIVDPIMQEAKMKKSFSQMTQHTPQLQEADQEKIKNYFNVIKTYSPHAAANPLVAGALVNKMMEWGGVDHKLVQDMVNIQGGKTNMESIKTMIGGGLKTVSTVPKED